MTQELIDLRTSILEGRYEDALVIIDELEGISKQATLRTIESFLVRLLVHLIKNQIEQRITNSWIASILILIDEWVAYARQLHQENDLPGGSFDTHFTFAQTLSESAKNAAQTL